jgi:hypothetical protein
VRPLFHCEAKPMGSIRFLAVLLPLMVYSPLIRAQEHVPEPAVNLGDTSFLDGIGGPGVLTETIGDAMHSSAIVDGSGQKVPVTGQVNSISSLTHIAWLSESRLLGAWYGMEIVVTAAHVNAGREMAAGGFGDLTVSPLVLQWAEKKVGQFALNQRLVFDFGLPVGQYSPNASVNLSSHAYTANPHYELTASPLKRVETSWRIHYLRSSENGVPPLSFGARSIQAGQAIHLNGTVSYEVTKNLWAGSNGYFLKQISDPKINGMNISSSPEQVGAIGPGMVWNHGEWSLYVNGYHEFGAENRPTGNKVVLRLEKVFGKEKKGT